MTTNGGTPALDALAELARQQAEKDGLEARLDVARTRLSAADDRAGTATMRLDSELDDVARLEQVSMTRILATLRGRRDQDLDRERAEAEAARWTAAEAEERRRAAEVEVDGIAARLASFGDLTARRVELLAQREAEVAADPSSRATAARLEEVATALGERAAEAVQVDEAVEAARVAAECLDRAARHLGSAGSWSTYDTFFGGGFFSDMAKYDNLDRAAVLMRQADGALGHLATELADVGMSSVGGIEVNQLTSFFDVWFDNIFSDWAVRDRIREASGRVERARAGVTQTLETLGGRRTTCLEASRRLAEEREELLGA
ncbi:hypothetical protein SAMN04489844_0501 [Nocardioides exalbidus]|uniref:Uncharacterized protein n=1 Tax=Nocardioides exalbidus TaxID=402596 RepID=A0A1H4KAQ5_9ACTN|nr:hypothetical protein [Nocardioides exalbidus]SEB55336.1 hypothetical protein SAMN04489844_0501 [Nocardioides exalbidus]